ncbi:SGNH/GDSL hydrolase family protein [Pyruvatibacter sp.]|uniref:SGNH/GDSL hydrolase family protein n=1 Tax=Pyruvatibacter sp. TaxID=1981328 RepID=UPI0032661E71
MSSLRQRMKDVTTDLPGLLRQIAPSAAMVTVAILVSFLFAEIAARAINNVPLLSASNWVTEALEAGTENLTSVYDSELGWKARKDMRRVGDSANHPAAPDFSKVTVTTNSQSLRMNSASTPIREEAPKGAIFAVGDSFTWGSEVSDHETYSAHLESILNRPVLNAAYGGWGLDQMYLRSKELVPDLKPSLIILSPLSDDHLRNAFRRYGRAFKGYYDLTADGGLELKGLPVPRNSAAARDVGTLQSVLGHSYFIFWAMQILGQQEMWVNRNLLTDQVHSFEESVEISCRLFPKFQDLAAEHGTDLLYVQIYGSTELLQGEQHWYSTQGMECARKAGIKSIDTYDAFMAVLEQEGKEALLTHYSVWKDGRVGHMSSKGNRLVASTIADALKAE